MKRISFILVFMILLSFVVCVSPAEEACAIRVGDIRYSVQEVQKEMDVYLLAYAYSNTPLTAEEKADLASAVAEAFVVQGLTEMKLKDLGLDTLDDNTVYSLRAIAQEQYDTYWQKLRQADTDGNMTDEMLTAYIAENGITLDRIYEELRRDYLSQRFMQYAGVKVDVTEEAVDDFYLNEFVQPYQERYSKNIPLFEEEVLYGGSGCLYTPEGYRLMEQILLPIPEEMQSQLDGIMENGAALYQQAQEVYNTIAAKAVAGEDVEKDRMLYLDLMDQYDQTDVKYGEVWAQVLPACQSTVDEIFTRLESGESFASLMEIFGTPGTLYYHPDSTYWSDDLKAAAETLENEGEVSQPVLCTDGLHILCYEKSIPGGPAVLEDGEQREIVRQTAEQARFNELLYELVEPLREEYPVEVDLAKIDY